MSKPGTWKPGQSGNPNGRPLLSDEIKEARQVTFTDFQNIIYVLLELNREEIQAYVSNPHATMKQLLIASILNKSLLEGDPIRLTWLMTAIFGKNILDQVKKEIEVGNEDFLRKIPTESLLAALKNTIERKP